MTDLYTSYTAKTPEEAHRQHEQIIERERACRRNNLYRPQHEYTLLPWSMEEMPGTTWRNVYTANVHTVERIAKNRFNKPGPDPDEYINEMFEPGLWRLDADETEWYCVEHWIRVDHLTPEIQVDWACARVAYRQQELAQQRQTLGRVKRGEEGGSVSYLKKVIAWHQEYVEQARLELQDLAARLKVPLTTNILNVGIQAGEQMVLLP